MISWIQKYFQHHFRIIFAFILVVVIISFVFTFSPGAGGGQGAAKLRKQEFFGVNLGAREDQERVFNDANLSVYLQAGYPALEGEQLQQYALQRHASIALANQLGVPAPSDTQIADHVKKLRAFAGQNGEFDAKRYSEFRDTLKQNPRLSEAQVGRVLADDLRAENVQKLLGGPGYVTPYEVKTQLSRADSSWTLAVANVDYASFNPTINATDAELTKYFEDEAFRYEIPPQVEVSALQFPSSQFASKVQATDAEIKAYYDANPARFPAPAPKTPADPAKPASSPEADFALVRPQVAAALVQEKAQRLAVKAASDLSVELFDKKISADKLPAYISGRGLTLKPLPPFSRQTPPPELAGSADAMTEAFKLNAERSVSDALSTADGAVILAWKQSIPARKPLLIEVRDRVAKDYQENEKRKRFVEAGRTIRGLLETRLKAGDTIEKAVAAANSGSPAKLDVKSYPAFTFRQPPQDLDYSALGAVQTLQQGQLSEMIISPENKGLIVYVTEKKLPDLAETNPKFAETKTQLAERTASSNSREYLGELIETELAKSAPTTN